jgi:hypothetical protein
MITLSSTPGYALDWPSLAWTTLLAWEGAVAMVGGLAAFVIGTTTLVEHLMTIRATHREMAPAHAETR